MKLNGKLWILGACFLMARPLFSQNAFLELNLNNPAVQNMARSMRPRPTLEIFRVIERAGNDKRISGIILNISSFQAGQETLWELRSALEKFKSKGKKVCAFISAADLDMYCLATVADKIVMDDQGSLALLGYAWGRGYVQHSLEKLGIGARELRYLEFKSAAETYTRDSLSDADRRQYGEVLDDIMTITRDTVTKARSWTAEEFDSIINNEFMFSAKSALARGLVDYTGRKEAALKAIREITGSEKENDFFLFGDSDSSLTGSKYFYHPVRANWMSRPPVIAVIYANGVTDMERGIAAKALARTIQEVSEKKRVKALVIRINSPGGSAEAADYVAEAVKNAKQRIPVVVSMGAVAASGGYWVSMNASHITASPVTLTGSIGVIGSWFYDKGLNSKLGMTVDTIQRGNHADLLTGMILPHRDLSPQEEARYREYILDLYGDFTARVAAGRNMDIARVEAAAQGRVYSGLGALNAGLIDSIGGLDDAVQTARKLAKISDHRKVAYDEYPKPKFFDKILDRLLAAGISGDSSTASAAVVTDLFLPGPLLEDLRFRIAHNGQVMPILPWGTVFNGPDTGK
ncbi:MAG: signal peptide peptidase SppA [Treponema sp.]|jgi:protease-4|nr:signal peptide peptidase SppA [Treponema sp.]